MKKALWFIAAAMMVLAACDKGKKDNKPIDEEEGEELIQIDGQFADWAALQDVVSVKRSNTWLGEEISEEHARIDALKEMKITSDQYNVYFYFEVDMSVMYRGGALNWDNKPTTDGYAAHLQIHLDTDCASVLKDPDDPESAVKTGYINWIYDNAGIDYYLECSGIFSKDAAKVGEMAGGTLLKYKGADGDDLWATDPPLQEEVAGEGICAGWGVLDGDIIKYEISITRSFLGLTGEGKKIAVGAEAFQDVDWELIGLLPQANTGAEGVWTGRMVEVTLL